MYLCSVCSQCKYSITCITLFRNTNYIKFDVINDGKEVKLTSSASLSNVLRNLARCICLALSSPLPE